LWYKPGFMIALFTGFLAYRGSFFYMILDRDSKFNKEITDFLNMGGVKPTRISPACPWQNGVTERWIQSYR